MKLIAGWGSGESWLDMHDYQVDLVTNDDDGLGLFSSLILSISYLVSEFRSLASGAHTPDTIPPFQYHRISRAFRICNTPSKPEETTLSAFLLPSNSHSLFIPSVRHPPTPRPGPVPDPMIPSRSSIDLPYSSIEEGKAKVFHLRVSRRFVAIGSLRG